MLQRMYNKEYTLYGDESIDKMLSSQMFFVGNANMFFSMKCLFGNDQIIRRICYHEERGRGPDGFSVPAFSGTLTDDIFVR